MISNFFLQKESTREKLKEYLFIFLFFSLLLIGILFLASPWLKEAIIKEATVNFSLGNFTVEEIGANQENAKEVSWDSTIEAPNLTTVLMNASKVNQEDVLGAVSISDVNILLPILNGTNTQNLLVGATTVNERQVMGRGNYVLAGHHMRDDTLLFAPLLQVEVGTLIQITDKASVYTYQVTEKKMVHETDLSILEETTVPTITLFTCDVSGVATDKRVVVRGELVDTSSYSADNEYVNLYQSQEENVRTQSYLMISGIVLIVGFVILFACGMIFIKGKRKI